MVNAPLWTVNVVLGTGCLYVLFMYVFQARTGTHLLRAPILNFAGLRGLNNI